MKINTFLCLYCFLLFGCISKTSVLGEYRNKKASSVSLFLKSNGQYEYRQSNSIINTGRWELEIGAWNLITFYGWKDAKQLNITNGNCFQSNCIINTIYSSGTLIFIEDLPELNFEAYKD